MAVHLEGFRFNRMDNAAFERENHSGIVEMGEVDTTETAATPTPTIVPANGNGVACSELCQSLHLQHQKNYMPGEEKRVPSTQESPWHRLKTIFLVGIIVILVAWIVVYTLLSQFKVL